VGISKQFRTVVVTAAASTMALVHAQGVTSNEVVLGQSVYLTGALAELGNDFTNGANAYFRKINDAGGVHGRKVRVVTRDDAYDPQRALGVVHELEKKVFALFQFAGTGTVREVSAVAAARQIPLVAAVATGPRLRAEHNPYTWYVRAGSTEELEAIVNHLMTVGNKRVATVHVDAPYGTEGLEAVQAIVARKGGHLVASAVMKTTGEGADQAARELPAAGPQAVVMITVPAASKAFISAAKQVRLRSTLYSLNAGLPIGAMRDLGQHAHGVIVTQVMPSIERQAIPVVREYRQDYLAAGHTGFSSASLEGYINAMVMVEALRRAGSNPTRPALARALDSMDSYDVGGFKVQYSNADHGGSRAVELSIGSVNGEKFIY